MEIQDYILVHGKIINIKNNVDDKYIWFDISKDEYYKDKDGHMKNNPSFFSARISKILSNKYVLDINIEVVVKGIPKGFIDKKGKTVIPFVFDNIISISGGKFQVEVGPFVFITK